MAGKLPEGIFAGHCFKGGNGMEVLATQDLLNQLEQIYRQYLEESEDLFRKGNGFLHAIRSVLGTNTIKSSPIHQRFYDAVAQQVEQLTKRLEQTADPLLADQAVRLLMEERPKGQDVTRYGWLSAAQTLAIPLLAYASRETVEELYPIYCGAHPRRDRLPRQAELIKAMEQRMQN